MVQEEMLLKDGVYMTQPVYRNVGLT
ncbi:hypothetical protein Goklo_014004 [Gossypium klotzschianum]|uniref:Uncharacterized protein n=1 Tax=Gossypium klotzschianum TaxID=34286 RepID=A0A7J8U6L1_9ROSI|nr:hypothetical protein [Gossypium klotzschianum]